MRYNLGGGGQQSRLGVLRAKEEEVYVCQAEGISNLHQEEDQGGKEFQFEEEVKLNRTVRRASYGSRII